MGENDRTGPLQKGSKIKKPFARRIAETLYQHPIWTLIIVTIVLLIIPFLLLLSIKLMDCILPNRSFTRLTDGTNNWLSFWGSYLGCIATVLLSICALFLSEKINRYTWHQNTSNEISTFSNFEVENVKLCKLDQSYPSELEVFDEYKGQHFLLEITFLNPFPPHYTVEIENITINKDDTSQGQNNSAPQDLQDSIRLVSNFKNTTLYFLTNHNDFSALFNAHLTRLPISREEKYRWLSVQMRCKNTLFGDERDYYHPILITLKLWLKNTGGNNDGSVTLNIEERKLSCKAVED